jgi:uncharacterized protein (DUF2249 family)
MTASTAQIDVRQIPPQQRHAFIFSTFESLPAGGGFELLNDHDPVPLYRQFEARHLGQFDWTYLETGPAQWRVRIGKLAEGAAAAQPGECCGCACRGA